MSLGTWVETNVVLPLGNLLLEPQNLQKIAAVFAPLFDNAVRQVGLTITASEVKVVNEIGNQAVKSEQAIGSQVTNIEQGITGLPNEIVNAIKGLNPFHFP